MTEPEKTPTEPRGDREAVHEAEEQAGGKWRLLRKRSPLHGLLALLFLGACLGALLFCVIRSCTRLNSLVFYFSVFPALLWFGALTPGLVVGAFALRRRWFIAGCLFCLLCFFSCEEMTQYFKFWSGGSREKYQAAEAAFYSFMERMSDRVTIADVPLRIVTWNIAAGQFGGEEGVRQLETLKPDLVLLQEYSWGKTQEMAEPLRKSKVFGSYFWASEKNFCKKPVLSRFPVTNLALADDSGRWLYAVYEIAVTPDLRIFVINVHLSTHRLAKKILLGWKDLEFEKDIETSRTEAAGLQKIVERYAAMGPVILGGDFNLPRHYPGLRFLKATHNDCFAENGFGWGKTVPKMWGNRPVFPVFRVDMIWTPEYARVYYASAVRTAFSDHDMTLAEVTVPVKLKKKIENLAPDEGR